MQGVDTFGNFFELLAIGSFWGQLEMFLTEKKYEKHCKIKVSVPWMIVTKYPMIPETFAIATLSINDIDMTVLRKMFTSVSRVNYNRN